MVRQWISLNTEAGDKIWDSGSSDNYIKDIVIKKQAGSVPSLSFTVEPGGRLPAPMTDYIYAEVISSDGGQKELFYGKVANIEGDFYTEKKVVCEGYAACLNDIGILELKMRKKHTYRVKKSKHKAEYTTLEGEMACVKKTTYICAPRLVEQLGFVQQLINTQLPEGKKITLECRGAMQSAGRVNLDFEAGNAMQLLITIADMMGASLLYEGRTIAFVPTSYNNGLVPRTINFADNLLDLNEKYDYTPVATAIIPLGSRWEESSYAQAGSVGEDWHRIDLQELYGNSAFPDVKRIRLGTSVNERYYYSIEDAELISRYGKIYTIVTWDEVGDYNDLYHKAKAHLQSLKGNQTVTLSAFDDTGTGIFEPFKQVNLTATPQGISGTLPIVSSEMHLGEPEKDTITLGTSANALTNSTASVSAQLAGSVANIIREKVVEPNNTYIINTIREMAEEESDLIVCYYNEHEDKMYDTFSNGGYSNPLDGERMKLYLGYKPIETTLEDVFKQKEETAKFVKKGTGIYIACKIEDTIGGTGEYIHEFFITPTGQTNYIWLVLQSTGVNDAYITPAEMDSDGKIMNQISNPEGHTIEYVEKISQDGVVKSEQTYSMDINAFYSGIRLEGRLVAWNHPSTGAWNSTPPEEIAYYTDSTYGVVHQYDNVDKSKVGDIHFEPHLYTWDEDYTELTGKGGGQAEVEPITTTEVREIYSKAKRRA